MLKEPMQSRSKRAEVLVRYEELLSFRELG